MEWIAVWYGVGLVGAYVGCRRAMVRMGARHPKLYDDPMDLWREVKWNGSTWFVISYGAILGPLSLPVSLFATGYYERCEK